MRTTKRPQNIHDLFHAHLYFDNESVDVAVALSEQAAELFGVKIGRVHKKCVGPHTQWSRQIIFTHQQFDELIPWLDQNRAELTIFVHGETGDGLLDHTEHAYWLGTEGRLNLEQFIK